MNAITAYQTTNGGLMIQQFDNSLFARWTAYIDAAPKTVQTYTRAIKQFAGYMSDQSIATPTREDVISYREYLRDAGKKPTTIDAYLMAVKTFFKWTAAENLYPNIADRVKAEKLDNTFKKDYLTSRQAAALLKNIDRTTINGLRDYAILSLMITTGLRTISIIRANIEDIRTAGDDMALYYQGKGHAERAQYVKLAPQVEDAIRAYLTARGEKNGAAPLFTSISHRNDGERMTTRSISRICKDRLKEIGIDSDRVTAHSLRHTAAVLNLMNGGTLEETRDLLGHTTTAITQNYTHMIQRANNHSENRIAAAVFA
jgi:integrase/recombinase XerD